MSTPGLHHDWLSLIEISGPFLAVPVLNEVFPQGLEELDGKKRKRLRQAYEEWRDALETNDPQFPELHAAWIDEVLSRGLELDEDGRSDVLKRASWCAAHLDVTLPEHGVTLSPDLAVVDQQSANKPLILIHTYPPNVDLDATLQRDGWAVTPADRMVQLCRSTGCRLGMVTNGERWMLIDAPVGGITTFASWYARIWGQEPVTLQAFVHLLGIRRYFVEVSEQLPALFDRSVKYQDDVTDALGEQVRRAVEVLIQALDKADQDRNRQLLRDVKEPEVYAAALTVMMRLVFLLSAEERGLLLLGDERYEAYYAISTLRMQLRTESEEILERRWDAWSRLLAIFRAVFDGIEHENLRLPAMGGSLFDPDRFPFLEGRAKDSNWRIDTAKPLPIDNRTVLLLLEAIQQFQGRTLSYRALDVEQIGYVYEGLLERTVKRTTEVTLELDATRNAKSPWVTLAELEAAQLDGAGRVAVLLQERSKVSVGRVRNDLNKPVDGALGERLLTACLGDTKLRDRIKPYTHLLRIDLWGYPLVYPAGAFIVASASDRRETGTHYTPKSLTEAVVTETLAPLAYIGPAAGSSRDKWQIKSAAELLDLKICDPAMGSGAFLVQVCRWLADRLVESWARSEGVGRAVGMNGDVLVNASTKEQLPRDIDSRVVIARRLVAERCLYGVDVNPLAVELAKLSIWLVTLAKDRPFDFLDHNLRCGDSLLGIHRLDQLTELSMVPDSKHQQRLFGQNVKRTVHEAIGLRAKLREMPIRDIHDVEAMARIDADARAKLELPGHIADAFIGEVFATSAGGATFHNAMESLAIQAAQAVDGDQEAIAMIGRRMTNALGADLPLGKARRKPFHWPLEFPEVFSQDRNGFDAVVGNPPFLGGKRISGAFGATYQKYLVSHVTLERSASVDLVVHFFIRMFCLLRHGGYAGLLGRRSLNEATNREVGLRQLLERDMLIYTAHTDLQWPGEASVVVHRVHMTSGTWLGQILLNDVPVNKISEELSDRGVWEIQKLDENLGRMFQGAILSGEGFKIDASTADLLIRRDDKYKRVVFPFIGGNEINKDPLCSPMCWVICFWDWPEQKVRQFAEAFGIVEGTVKPERLQGSDANMKKNWWQFLRPRPELYHAIGCGDFFTKHMDGWSAEAILAKRRVLVISTGTTKYPAFTFLPSPLIYSNKLCVLADDRCAVFAVLTSDIHGVWAWDKKTTLQADMESMRYAHGNIFETFPFPGALLKEGDSTLERLGVQFFEGRQAFMSELGFGLTKFYNAFHDSQNHSEALTVLRCMQEEMNRAVLRLYGWEDIDPASGFHEVGYLPAGKNVRFTISESARHELLGRLSRMNRAVFEQQGAPNSLKVKHEKLVATTVQDDLFSHGGTKA